MSRKTDIKFGRRGGHFLPDDYEAVDFAGAPLCDVCGDAMVVHQRGRHFVCDASSMVGERCSCGEGCTKELVGDGGNCDPECRPCALQRNVRHSDVAEWRRFK